MDNKHENYSIITLNQNVNLNKHIFPKFKIKKINIKKYY